MDIENAIIEFGTHGVLRYREISDAINDNELPETFLGGFIAVRLYDRFRCPVHVERLYTTLAIDLQVNLTVEFERELGGLRADIAMYHAKLPSALVELKILDETTPLSSALDDRCKLEKLARVCKIDTFLGAMICETSSANLEKRVAELEHVLGKKIHTGLPMPSIDDKWKWCFGCTDLR